MRVLLIGSSPHAGLLYHPVRLAIALKNAGCDVHVVSMPGRNVSPELPGLLAAAGIPLLECAELGKSGLHAVATPNRKLAAVAAGLRPDIMHTFGPVAGWQIASVWRRRRPRVVCMVEAMGHEHLHGIRRQSQRVGAWMLNASADMVLALCELERQRLAAMGVSVRKLRVLHNPLDCDDILARGGDRTGVRAQILKELNWPENTKIMGCFANFQPRKRHDIVVRAFAAAAQHAPDWRLVCAGEGPTREEVQRLAEKVRGQCEIKVLPRLTSDRIYHYVNACDGVVHASNAETFGFSLIEPLLFQKACVITRVGVGLEIERAGCAQVIAPNDLPAAEMAIGKLIMGGAAIEVASAKGPEFVRTTFDVQAIARALMRIYAEVEGVH